MLPVTATDRSPGGRWRFALLAAGAVLLWWSADAESRALLGNTLLLVAATTAIGAAVGVPLALVAVKTDVPGARWLLAVVASLIFVPLPLVTAAWQAALGRDGWLAPPGNGELWLAGWRGAIWIHSTVAVAWVTAIMARTLANGEPELEEQALLTRPAWRVVTGVTLPLALDGLAAAVLWVALQVAGEMAVTDVFQIRTFAEQIFTELSLGQPWQTAGSLTGWLLVGLLTVAAWQMLSLWLLRPRLAPTRPRWVARLGAARWPLAATMLAVALLLVGVPLANLFYKGGLTIVRGTAGWEPPHWSAEKLLAAITKSLTTDARMWGWTLLIGGLAAATATTLAVALCWGGLSRRWLGYLAMLLTALAAAIPGPLLGLVLIGLLNRDDCPLVADLYDHSILAPWLAETIRALPIAMLIVAPALTSIPRAWLDDSQLLGRGPIATLFKVALPLRGASLGLALLAALAVATGELAATTLVVPPGISLMSVRLFGLIHFGVDQQVAAISLIDWLGLSLLAVAALWLGRRMSRESSDD